MEKMTDTQKKAAARELCRMRGIDPEKKIAHDPAPGPNGFVPAILIHSPAWMLAMCEIEAQEHIESAMEYGRAQEE